MEDFDGISPPNQMDFHITEFWICMHGLPLACMGKETGVKLGTMVGRVEEVDTNVEGVGWGEYLRVRLHVNLTKPLVRGRVLKVRDRTIWITFQYEKISWFCIKRGVIRHGCASCPLGGLRKIHDKDADDEFGPWLHASSPKRWLDRNRGRNGGDSMETEDYPRRGRDTN